MTSELTEYSPTGLTLRNSTGVNFRYLDDVLRIPSGIYRQVIIQNYHRIPNSQDNVSDERKMELCERWLCGFEGAYRSKNTPLIKVYIDQQAVDSWLATVATRSENTLRSYKKEAQRFMMWAYYEVFTPISSMSVDVINAYQEFLANPVSKFEGTNVPHINWVSKKVINPITGKSNRRVTTKAGSESSMKRVKDEWSPFDGPLSPSSIDYSMNVLKSMYSYLVNVDYLTANPVKIRKNIAPKKQSMSNERFLNEDTWAFLFNFIETSVDRIPPGSGKAYILRVKRQAHQRIMIFASLYLLGVRLSELINIRMKHFIRRAVTKTKTVTYWVIIQGKGNKTRQIPVPGELMDYIRRYRSFLNETSEHILEKKYNLEPIYTDDTPLILSKSGTSKAVKESEPDQVQTTETHDKKRKKTVHGDLQLTSTTIHRIVKQSMADCLAHYHERVQAGDDLRMVFPEQLERASTHWMRHTSATHQSARGASLKNLKEFLGHSDYNTTLIYSHVDKDEWESEIDNFKIKDR